MEQRFVGTGLPEPGREPLWPVAWSTACPARLPGPAQAGGVPATPVPCNTVLQGGPRAFHAHWVVVHLGQSDPRTQAERDEDATGAFLHHLQTSHPSAYRRSTP